MRKFCFYCCFVILISVWGCQPSDNSNVTEPTAEPTIAEETMNNNTEVPQAVIDAVLNDITQEDGINADTLEVQQTEANTWPDGCLGLAGPDEMCTQALVEGWRVTVSDGETTWVYRTDQTGGIFRRES